MALTKVKTTGLADGTDGQVITYDANGNPIAVGPGTDGQVLTSTGAGSPPAFEAASAGGISDIVSDTSPQLGGDLDIQANKITTSTTDGNIKLEPNGAGEVLIEGNNAGIIKAGTSGENLQLKASGAYINIQGGVNGGVQLTAVGTGKCELASTSRITKLGAGSAEETLTTHMSGAHIKIEPAGTSGNITVKSGANEDIELTPNGTGDVVIDGLKYPQADGSADQVLKTDGSAQLSWTTISGGVSSDADTNTVAGTNAGNAGTWSGANGNTCMGYNSGTDLTSGDYNTLHGEESGANLTTGYKNVAIGNKALETSTNGFENVVIGWSALPVVPYGTQNVAVGCKALESGDDAGIRENVAVGFEALKDLTGTYTQAYGNTAIGYMAGKDNDDKPENCFLGRQAGMNQTMTFGELWIAHRDHAKGTDSVWIHGDQYGNCINGNNSSSWSTTSDERIKKNIVDNNVGLEKIKQLKVRNFEYRVQKETGTDSEGHTTWAPKTDSDVIDTSTFTTLPNGQKPRPDQVAINKTGVQLGCIAQEVEAVLPNSVHTDANGCKSVKTDEMFWVMINAVKQLSDKNDALEARIATLEAA